MGSKDILSWSLVSLLATRLASSMDDLHICSIVVWMAIRVSILDILEMAGLRPSEIV